MKHNITLTTVLWTMIAIIVISAYGTTALLILKHPIPNDFTTIYMSVQQYWQGISIYTPNTSASDLPHFAGIITDKLVSINLNTPFFNTCFLPITLLPEKIAYIVWLALSLFFFALGMFLLKKRFSIIALGFLFYPTFGNYVTGEVAMVLFLLLVISFVAIAKDKPYLAASILGTLFALKLFFGLFLIYFILRKQWQALALMSAIFCLCNILAACILGWEVFLNYLITLAHIRWYASTWNASLIGCLSRVFGGYYHDSPVWINAPMLTPYLYYFATAILLLGAYRLRALPQILFSYLLIAMLLISPLGWLYYFIFLLIPLSVIYFHRGDHLFSYMSLICAFLAIIFISIPYLDMNPALIRTYHILILQAAPFYGLCLLCVAICLHARAFEQAANLTANKIPCHLVYIAILLVASLYSMFFLTAHVILTTHIGITF